MIDQKLINEMAALIEDAETNVENWHCRDTNCSNCAYTYCKSSAIAEELLEHYQPKLPENSVAISKEEYETLQKQIKEEDLSEAIYMSGHGLDWADSDDIANQLYNQLYKGYTKILENSVVISKEEYEELKYPTTLEASALVKENNDLRDKCGHWANLYYKASKELNQARKQVAKEVLWLLDEMRVKEDDRHQWRENHNYCIRKCKTRIAKEFGLTLNPEE